MKNNIHNFKCIAEQKLGKSLGAKCIEGMWFASLHNKWVLPHGALKLKVCPWLGIGAEVL